MLRLINKGTDEQQVNLLTSMDSDIARRGISNEDFAAFNRDLYDANPAAMEAARPFSSGAFVRGLANFSPMNLGRNLLTDFFSKFGKQSGSIVDDTPADEIGLDLAQTMQMAERNPNQMGVMALDTLPGEGELMGEFVNRKFNEDPIIQKYFGNKEKEKRMILITKICPSISLCNSFLRIFALSLSIFSKIFFAKDTCAAFDIKNSYTSLRLA